MRLQKSGKYTSIGERIRAYLKKGWTWIDSHKADIGFTRVGGELHFKKSDVDDYCVRATLNKPKRNVK